MCCSQIHNSQLAFSICSSQYLGSRRLYTQASTSQPMILRLTYLTTKMFKRLCREYSYAYSIVFPQLTKSRDVPTLLSLNRFERKKNAALAIKAFLLLRRASSGTVTQHTRLVLGGMCDYTYYSFETNKVANA